MKRKIILLTMTMFLGSLWCSQTWAEEESGTTLSDIKMLESAAGDPSLDLLKRLADSMEMELRISFVPVDR